MIYALTVIILLSVSFLITKVAAIALVHTGLSWQSAKFQARSAFTGVGYATKESENVVNHPLRRKIVMLLMILGNAGIVSIIATLLLTILNSGPTNLSLAARIGLLVGGIILISFLFNSKVVDKGLSKIINYTLQKYTKLNIKDYSALLHLSGEYEISEIYVEQNTGLADKTLRELALSKEGLSILGISRRGGKYIGTPNGDTKILPGDTLIIYGKVSSILHLKKPGK